MCCMIVIDCWSVQLFGIRRLREMGRLFSLRSLVDVKLLCSMGRNLNKTSTLMSWGCLMSSHNPLTLGWLN